MEDVLDLYEEPCDPQYPTVCLDEKPLVLHADVHLYAYSDYALLKDSASIRRAIYPVNQLKTYHSAARLSHEQICQPLSRCQQQYLPWDKLSARISSAYR